MRKWRFVVGGLVIVASAALSGTGCEREKADEFQTPPTAEIESRIPSRGPEIEQPPAMEQPDGRPLRPGATDDLNRGNDAGAGFDRTLDDEAEPEPRRD